MSVGRKRPLASYFRYKEPLQGLKTQDSSIVTIPV